MGRRGSRGPVGRGQGRRVTLRQRNHWERGEAERGLVVTPPTRGPGSDGLGPGDGDGTGSAGDPPETDGSTASDGAVVDPAAVAVALRRLVPPEHGPSFWDDLDRRLADEPQLRLAPRAAIRPITQPPPVIDDRKLAEHLAEPRPRRRRSPARLAAWVLAIVLSALLIAAALQDPDEETTTGGPDSSPTSENRAPTSGGDTTAPQAPPSTRPRSTRRAVRASTPRSPAPSTWSCGSGAPSRARASPTRPMRSWPRSASTRRCPPRARPTRPSGSAHPRTRCSVPTAATWSTTATPTYRAATSTSPRLATALASVSPTSPTAPP